LIKNEPDPASQQGLPIAQNYLITRTDVNLQDYLPCKDYQTFISRQGLGSSVISDSAEKPLTVVFVF
jgi:hypothetical protein